MKTSAGGMVLVAACTACMLMCALVLAAGKHRNPSTFDFLPDGEWGDWNGVMTGRIIDENGAPIPYAHVRVHSKDIEIKCDKNGFFTVRGLQKGGHYSLIVDAKGYDDAVLRWIPMQTYETTDIGDYHLVPEALVTNFWTVSSNVTAGGTWAMTSNLCEIADGVTSVYAYAEWGVMEYMKHGSTTPAGVETNMALIDERPAAATNAPARPTR